MIPNKLLDGYKYFIKNKFKKEQIKYKNLALHGQKPECMIISCCDSRVSPEVIFNVNPGEMFVIRNVANIVPPYDKDHKTSYHGTSAAIEFAVNVLNIKHIIVLGHASCGGIASLLNDRQSNHETELIDTWMSQIKNIVKNIPFISQDYIKELEISVIKYSMKNLLSFPYILRKVNNKELTIHGAYFRIYDGLLLNIYD
ncbi:Carbonic anhydrase 1 [Candidatus Kinetoplastibacterium sorsogonicusi]|uniref:Carbonic anhydrase n=1 Tax=Candidatus Kinetoplastidibacterium kentomonadis TaxID=1576550 RepID=A0A3Q8F638_9PROT|nr:carbonic anhydrase [Candidatus Kinetoplastibacterium sorsogonicusi]AWD32218.1 Carbonic anhydrase 1 [Candidatus Kinetoplastibacterium sorsogonicusi]